MKFEITTAKYHYHTKKDRTIMDALKTLNISFKEVSLDKAGKSVTRYIIKEDDPIIDFETLEDIKSFSIKFHNSLIVSFYVTPIDNIEGTVCIYNDYIE